MTKAFLLQAAIQLLLFLLQAASNKTVTHFWVDQDGSEGLHHVPHGVEGVVL